MKLLDKNRAKNIDSKNKVRLIRAIEIAKYLGRVPSLIIKPPIYKFIKVGLFMPSNVLENKIKQRVEGMFKMGLLREINNLKKSRVTQKRLKEFGFEYFKPTKEKVINETVRYAKRQMTWFKRDQEIKWFKPNEYKRIKKYILKNF